MINHKLVRNYTSALFHNALANSLEDKVLQQITVINQFINDNPQIKEVIFSPIIEDTEKYKIIESITRTFNVESIVQQFLLILLKHSRISILPNIIASYQQLVSNSKNIKMVTIISAKALQNSEKKWLTKYLEDDLQQKVDIIFNQNETIIGGIVVQYDSIVRDYSIAGTLEKITKTLKETKVDNGVEV